MAGPGEYITRNPHIARAIAAFVGVSWYLSIELNIRIFMTFKRRTGLYFWSCLTCSWGLMLNQVFGAVLWDFGVTTNIWIVFPGIFVTWAMMVCKVWVRILVLCKVLKWLRKAIQVLI